MVRSRPDQSGLAGKFAALFLFILLIATLVPGHSQNMFEVLNSPTEYTFVASSFINDNEGWLADNNAVLWHTADAGQSWTAVSSGKNFLKMDFADGLSGFALGEAKEAYRTSDGGVTWEVLPLVNVGSTLWCNDSNLGIITGDSLIYRTTDGGDSWTTVLITIPFFSDLYFIDESNGIATACIDDEYKSIWRTTDGGITWSNVYNEPKYFLYSVWFINQNTGFAAGYYDQPGWGMLPAINKTSDGGITWENIYIDDGIINRGESLTDIRFQDELNGFAIGSYGESVYTTDGGATWTSARASNTTGLPMLSGIYKALDGYSNMFIVGKDGYVIKW
jgi:photosystem II stability/assembly factor-like uncharacterized protein